MGKGKKKHSKKDQLSDDLLDSAALSIKKFRKVTKQITKLSTGQKIVGSIALLAAGLTYLAKQDFETEEKPTSDAAPAHHLPTHAGAHFATEEDAAAPISAPRALRHPRKTTKAKHES